ncbi:MAG: hypothetical protein H2054_05535 [Sphingomonas sp.]|uniref:CC_3452 family protein n=1 Tax=Sphingomonas sp. TaxID=28214 RepID=UPI000DB00C5C|nr:hypothetical protein [Zymomonas sp.]MBA4772556.1 hypothetical protein [Sphingomonas sp.]PZP20000.1 MAG: hypothetical protein DI607_01020 [Sphingomonas hengshuiensis]
MTRLFPIATLAASLIAVVPAVAQTAGYYAATPATAPTKNTLITSGTLWKCADGVCGAAKSTQRDVIMCQMVAQRVGKLNAFSVAGAAFDEATLAKCNTVAR